MRELAVFDTGHWSEVARVEIEPSGTLAVFQSDPDRTIRYIVFRRSRSGFWYSQYQSGHFPSVEEAVADSVKWRG